MKIRLSLKNKLLVTVIGGIFIVISLFVILLPKLYVNAADGPDQAVVSDLNKQIDEQRAKIDAMTAKIAEYNSNVKANQQEAATLKTQIKLLDNQVGKTNMEIILKEEQAKEVQLEIEQTGLKINQSEVEIAKHKEQLADILRLIGRYEDKNYISILLANNSFSDFFDQIKYSTDLQQEMQRTLNRVKEATEKLVVQKTDLEKQKSDLSIILNKLDDTKAVLVTQKQDKNQLVVATSKSEKKYQALIASLKKEQAAANAQVAAMEKKIRAELAKKGTAEKFNSLGNAVLIWPTTSHRITATFHDPSYPFIATIGQHSGLDIGVGLGTPIKAAEAGYVAKVAYNTKWYGTYIMIIHGGNITTLYGHLSSINVKQDEYVTRGQLIGLSGSTGFSSGPHLHFEVRSNGVAVNPQSYLP
ncbi:MAG: peptidoglycan DD-metalloendopeptidase family protein [Candidatus Buchananbacteria bacterium]